MEARETRRDRSWRHARRAQQEHLRAVHPDGRVDCPCEQQSVWFFAKRKSVGCDYRKRRRGQPKVGLGTQRRRSWQPAASASARP
jgi:hypothetical protein